MAALASLLAASTAWSAGPVLVPPAVTTRVDAEYPADASPAGNALSGDPVTVVLTCTVAEDGHVSGMEVVESGGPALDGAAMRALSRWQFTAATRDGTPVKSRIRVPFTFLPPPPAFEVPNPAVTRAPPAVPPSPSPPPSVPAATSTTPPSPPAAAAPPAAPALSPDAAEALSGLLMGVVEVNVRGRRPPPPRAVSDFTLSRAVLSAAPRRDAGDLLNAAPGVYVARPEGDAVAQEIQLRGFDAAHGQDLELTLGVLPINQPSHLHGQGYADLGFIIPDTVRNVRVTEGVYDPRQGDFAVAGSIAFDLAVPERGYRLRTTYGSFNTAQQTVLWAPRDLPEETFAAALIRKTDGFGDNRGSLSGTAMAQMALGLPAGFTALVNVGAAGARASLAGVLRREDEQAGRVGFYDSYRDASANAQSALSTRAHAAVSAERGSAAGARTMVGAWAAFNTFLVRENFTGYTQRSVTNPRWLGRGDLMESSNESLGMGARAFQRTPRITLRDWLHGNFELGMSFRTDLIEQRQNLLQAPRNEVWDNRVDASIRGADIGVYLDADWRVTRHLRFRGGPRVDVLYYAVNDRLGNRPSPFAVSNNLTGYNRSAIGLAYGPRGSVDFEPFDFLLFNLAAGEGYRSPQARQLEEGQTAPFTKVRSAELGFRVSPGGADRFHWSGAAFMTQLTDDLAFDPSEGRLEKVGPTSRRGLATVVYAHPWDWLTANVSATYVNATLDAPPAATADNPNPAFRRGQPLPYVPPLVVRWDVGLKRDISPIRRFPVEVRAGTGATFLSSRPLPYSQQADPVFLWDVSAGITARYVELGVDIFNVLNSRYAATEYSFVSQWDPAGAPSFLPARHFSAGAPRTVLFTLGLHL